MVNTDIETITNEEIEALELADAKDVISAAKAKLAAEKNKSARLETANTKLKKQWQDLSNSSAEDIKKAKKGLINPKIMKDVVEAAKPWMVSKEDYEKLQIELQALKAEGKISSSSTSDSVLQEKLVAWINAFPDMEPEEAKGYWDWDGERMQEIINHYKEENERLIKDNNNYAKMYNELRPTLARANFVIEALEKKLKKYEPHDDSWVSQVQIPHKN